MINKQDFREICIKRLQKDRYKSKYRKDKQINSTLYTLIKEENLSTIMLYVPLKMEVNIYPLIKQLRKEKRKLYVPFMEEKSFRLVRYRLPLYKKKFGIKEPNNSKQYRIKKIDLAIVPIIGVDITLRRVGFGKGMYDRFFEKEYENIKQVVFVSRDLCYSKDIVTNHYDVKADRIVVS